MSAAPDVIEGVIKLYSGGQLDLRTPHPHQICIRDIAHALSQVTRYGGHGRRFYSVAEHSVHVYDVVIANAARHGRAAILHDAAEAYLGDMPAPLKLLLPKYRELEQVMEKAIADRFGLEQPMQPEGRVLIKKVDVGIRAWERQALWRGGRRGFVRPPFDVYEPIIECWGPLRAEKEFLERFHEADVK